MRPPTGIPDLDALEAACDELWGDPDDEARPDPVAVAGLAATVMVRTRCSFADACARLAAHHLAVVALEQQLRVLRGGLR